MQNNKNKKSTSNSGNPLLEPSILPTWLNQRSIGFFGFIWLWVGMAVIIATFQLGAGGVAGLPLLTVILIIFLANLALGVVMTLTADIGTEHGLSFAVFLRAPFGIKGTHLPSVSRGIVAAIWFGVQTYLGALALNGIVEYLTGFDNWIVWYVLFAAVQMLNTALGIRAVEKLANLAAPIIILISIWMYYTLDVTAQAQGLNFWTFAGDADISVVALFFANMAFWSALAVDIPNLTRYLKTETGSAARGTASHTSLDSVDWCCFLYCRRRLESSDRYSGAKSRLHNGSPSRYGRFGSVVNQQCG